MGNFVKAWLVIEAWLVIGLIGGVVQHLDGKKQDITVGDIESLAIDSLKGPFAWDLSRYKNVVLIPVSK